MEFVKIPLDLPQNFRFMRFKNRLGIDDAQALGHLASLWIWSFQYAQDGWFDRDMAPCIAQVAMWRGEPEVFIDALLTCGAKGQPGFLEETEDGYQLNEWEEFCGKTYEKRTKEAERKRAERAKRSAEAADLPAEVRSADAQEMSGVNPADTPRTFTGQAVDICGMSAGRPADNLRTSGGCPVDVPRTSAPEREKEKEKEKRTETNPARPEGLADLRADTVKPGSGGEVQGPTAGSGSVSADGTAHRWPEMAQEGTLTLGGFMGLDFGDGAAEDGKAAEAAVILPALASSPVSLCPHQAIIELYHEILPELPRVMTWGKTCQKYLQTRWRESRERQNIGWWRGYFESIRSMDWLMGRGQSSFIADLEWLVTQKNMTKILNGRYLPRNPKIIPHSQGFSQTPQRSMSVDEYVAAFIREDSIAIS